MNVAAALREAAGILRRHRVGAPELDARVLLGDVLGRDRAWLIAHAGEELGGPALETLRERLRRRCEGVPTQYIRGVQEFYGLQFRVTPDVLIPRPETEHLVEEALRRLRAGDRVLDIGTGSGAVAVAIARHAPSAVVAAGDISPAALHVARSNAAALSARVDFCLADIGSAFAAGGFDMVVSNPPYIPLKDAAGLPRELRHEPPVALFGGEDGLDVTRRLLRDSARILRPGGWLLFETGFRCRPAVEQLLRDGSWTGLAFQPDLAGIDRIAIARRAQATCSRCAGLRPLFAGL